MIGPPSGYDNAYFEIKSIRVFGTGTANGSSSSSSSGEPETVRSHAFVLALGSLAAAYLTYALI